MLAILTTELPDELILGSVAAVFYELDRRHMLRAVGLEKMAKGSPRYALNADGELFFDGAVGDRFFSRLFNWLEVGGGR